MSREEEEKKVLKIVVGCSVAFLLCTVCCGGFGLIFHLFG